METAPKTFRRKWLTAAAIPALVLVAALLAGCGEGTHSKVNVRKIKFWHIQMTDPTKSVIDKAVGRYEIAHANAAVLPTPYKNDTYKQVLSQAMAASNTPDVFHTWGGGVLRSFVRDRQVADLTAMAEADNLTKRIFPPALRFGTVDGKIYAIPMDMAVVVMWYNRSIFEKNGIAVPATFEELKAACVKLSRAGVTPIALGNKDRWPGAFYFVYLATRIGGTQPFADAESRAPGGTFEHPSFIEAGRKLQELVKAGAFNAGANTVAYDDARDLFVREKAAMILMGTWFLADLKSDGAAVLDRTDFFPFPAVEGGKGDPRIAVGGINSAYAVSSRSAYPADAYGLIREFTSDETAIQWAQTGRIPALTRDCLAGMLEPKTERAARLLFDAPEFQLYYDQYLEPRLGEAHKATVQSLIAGTMTPEEAARTMEALAAEVDSGAKKEPAK